MSRITRSTCDRPPYCDSPLASPRLIAPSPRLIAPSPRPSRLTSLPPPSPHPLRRPPNASHYESEHFPLRPQERASESPTHLAVGDGATLSHPLTQDLTVAESRHTPKKIGKNTPNICHNDCHKRRRSLTRTPVRRTPVRPHPSETPEHLFAPENKGAGSPANQPPLQAQ
jgi:hypothetical protein